MAIISTVLSGAKKGLNKIYETLDSPQTRENISKTAKNIGNNLKREGQVISEVFKTITNSELFEEIMPMDKINDLSEIIVGLNNDKEKILQAVIDSGVYNKKDIKKVLNRINKSGSIDINSPSSVISFLTKYHMPVLDSDGNMIEEIEDNFHNLLKNINQYVAEDMPDTEGLIRYLKKNGQDVFSSKQMDSIQNELRDSIPIDFSDLQNTTKFFKDNYDTGMSGYTGLFTEEVINKKLTPSGKRLVYGITAGVAAYSILNNLSDANTRIRMGNIDADTEGLPNKISSNGSPIEISNNDYESVIKQQPGYIRTLGADGELAMSLHKLYGTGRQKFI